MKRVIFIEANDIHIKNENIESVKELIKQMCDLGDSVKCKQLLILGDIFEARPAQKQGVLIGLTDMLDYIHERGFKAFIIPGNHDKSDYSSHDSYLTPYQNHPAIFLMSRPTYVKAGDMFDNMDCQFDSYFLPFYEEKTWSQHFDKMISDYPVKNKSILFGHWSVNGSTNNDGTKIDNGIKPSIFKKFDKVLLGHYHNSHSIGSNIFHLPSITQTNFGEDNRKGFTMIYSDGSMEFIKSKFKEFVTVKVNIDKLTQTEINEIVDNNINGNVRVELTGDKEKLDSLDFTKLRDSGMKIVKKDSELEVNEIDSDSKLMVYNDDSILVEFKSWCESEKLNHEEGVKHFN